MILCCLGISIFSRPRSVVLGGSSFDQLIDYQRLKRHIRLSSVAAQGCPQRSLMGVEVLQGDARETAPHQGALQDRERSAAVSIQEWVGREYLGVEPDRGEHKVVELDRVGLFLLGDGLVELVADLLEVSNDPSAECGAFALDDGLLGGAQDYPVLDFLLALA